MLSGPGSVSSLPYGETEVRILRLVLFTIGFLIATCICSAQVAGHLNSSDAPVSIKRIDSPEPKMSFDFSQRPITINTKSPSLRRELTRPTPPKKQFLLMSALVYAAAAYDMRQTTLEKQRWNRSVSSRLQTCPQCISDGRLVWFSDSDPLARPIVNLPTPAYVAAGIALATGVNCLSLKMGRSHRFHKVWFVPQLISIGGNSWGGSTYR